jgi:hypothetical protein
MPVRRSIHENCSQLQISALFTPLYISDPRGHSFGRTWHPKQVQMLHIVLSLLTLFASVTALDPNCHPGGNFDLTKWNLQLPIGSTGSPSTISAGQLQSCSGYSSSYFYTDGSGDLVMTVPGSPSSSGCVTTPNSQHCRTELREISPSSWSPLQGLNRLKVDLTVTQPDNSQRGTVIGQIHIDDSISR